MAAIHWRRPLGGGFTNPADWSGGAVPGAQDRAIIDATGAPYVVTSTARVTVQGVQVGADAIEFDGLCFREPIPWATVAEALRRSKKHVTQPLNGQYGDNGAK